MIPSPRIRAVFAFLLLFLFLLLAVVLANADVQGEEGEDAPLRHNCIQSKILSKQQQKQQEDATHTISTGNRKANAQALAPLRFTLRTGMLFDNTKFCASSSSPDITDFQGGTVICNINGGNSVLTSEKRNILIDEILPAATQKLSNALLFEPQGNVLVPSTSACGSDVTIPVTDTQAPGIDTDFVLYIAAAPIGGGTLAFASSCSSDSSSGGRSTSGYVVFDPAFLFAVNFTHFPQRTESVVSTAAHEILHSLKFLSGNITKKQAFRRRKQVSVVGSTNVLAKAREYFNCVSSEFDGVEVEDEGGPGTASAHWEKLQMYDSVMTGSSGFFSKLDVITLAAMEDANFGYTANYSAAGAMQWMQNATCSPFYHECNNSSPLMSPDSGPHALVGSQQFFFCNETQSSSTDSCTFDNRGLGRCSFQTYTSDIVPNYFAHFENPKQGGSQTSLLDFCPIVQQSLDCSDASKASNANYQRLGHLFGFADSRCLTTSSLIERFFFPVPGIEKRCLRVRCFVNEGLTKIVQIRVFGIDSWIDCPADSSMVSLPTTRYESAARIHCPKSAQSFCTSDLLVFGNSTTTSGLTLTSTSASTTTTATTTTTTTTTSSSSASSETTSGNGTAIASSSSTTTFLPSTSTTSDATTTSTTTLLATSSSTPTTSTANSAGTSSTSITPSTTTSTTTSTATSSPGGGGGRGGGSAAADVGSLSGGEVAGVVAGSLVGFALLVLAIVFLYRRHKRGSVVKLDAYLNTTLGNNNNNKIFNAPNFGIHSSVLSDAALWKEEENPHSPTFKAVHYEVPSEHPQSKFYQEEMLMAKQNSHQATSSAGSSQQQQNQTHPTYSPPSSSNPFDL